MEAGAGALLVAKMEDADDSQEETRIGETKEEETLEMQERHRSKSEHLEKSLGLHLFVHVVDHLERGTELQRRKLERKLLRNVVQLSFQSTFLSGLCC